MWTEQAPGANIMEYYAGVTERLRRQEDAAPQENNRPWRDEELTVSVSGEDLVGKELEDLYNETVAKTLPQYKRTCFACGKPVDGPSRVTDGELFWHVTCAGSRARPQLTAEAA
jgi:hypothetical protein